MGDPLSRFLSRVQESAAPQGGGVVDEHLVERLLVETEELERGRREERVLCESCRRSESEYEGQGEEGGGGLEWAGQRSGPVEVGLPLLGERENALLRVSGLLADLLRVGLELEGLAEVRLHVAVDRPL